MATRHRGAPGFSPARLADARHAAGLRQEDLAVSIGARRLYVTNLERGAIAPSPPRLKALADVLNVHPLWLLDAESEPTLVQLRFAAGLYQREAATALNISDAYLARLEMGLRDYPEKLVCHTPPVYLCTQATVQSAISNTKKFSSKTTGPSDQPEIHPKGH